MLHRDTLELIQQTAREAQSATLLKDLNTDGRTAWVNIAGELREVKLPPTVRKHTVHSLDDLILYAARAAEDCENRADNPNPPAGPVVWHGRSGVVLVIDDADRRDLVQFPLTFSERYQVLRRLAEKRPALMQAEFVRLLRLELGFSNAIVGQFRRLQWQAGSTTVGDLRHGQDKLGKDIQSVVQGVDELPEDLDVPAPVYQQYGEDEEYLVRCSIEIDTQNQRLYLIPKPDELERVADKAQASIRARLEGRLQDEKPKVPIYYGQP